MGKKVGKVYRIRVKTLAGNILTFNGVTEYRIEKRFLTFNDAKTGNVKRFAVCNSEVEESG